MDEDRLLVALRKARGRPPWTERIVEEYADQPEEVKQTATACDTCPRPCEADEVCATVIGRETGLLDDVGRTQAYHLVESGAERSSIKGRIDVRIAGEQRPHTFFRVRDTPRNVEDADP